MESKTGCLKSPLHFKYKGWLWILITFLRSFCISVAILHTPNFACSTWNAMTNAMNLILQLPERTYTTPNMQGHSKGCTPSRCFLMYNHPLFLLAPFLGSSLLNTQYSNLEGKMVLDTLVISLAKSYLCFLFVSEFTSGTWLTYNSPTATANSARSSHSITYILRQQ